jgi:hypothetical protein
MRPFERMIGELELRDRQVRYLGQARVQAQCPAHDDRTPSLSITEADGKVLLHCHAGCEIEDVLAAIGLEKGDLFADNGSGHRGEEQVYRYQRHVPNGEIVFPVEAALKFASQA